MLFEQTIKKIKMVKLFIVLLSLALIFKVGYIQIIDRKTIYDKALESWQRSFPVQANRGKIYDCSGNILATDLTTASLVVVPSQIQDKATTAISLSKILQVDAKSLEEKLNKKVSIQRISPEGRQLDDEKALRIQRLNLSGVYLIKDTKRYYPLNQYLSHCLGFVGIDNQGLSGLELQYDKYLTGESGAIKYFSDAKGNKLNLSDVYLEPQDGMNLQLTIDINIQKSIERELNNIVDMFEPDMALAIVMNPNTGEIYGMGSRPDYDPNNYQNYNQQVLSRNLPIWATYEPGSTQKIITTSAAVEEKVVDLDNDLFYDSGSVKVDTAKIKCWKAGGHGQQTFMEVLQNSCNPGFVKMGQLLGKDRLFSYLDKFGFGAKTGVDLSGEGKGIIFPLSKVGNVELATTAFGQGISVTPIQQVTAVSAVVNGGKLYQPYILKSISEKETGNIIKKNSKKFIRQTISKETSNTMRRALENVVAKGGGKAAYIDGYRIGGKTGTAQKVENGVYLVNNYIMSFMAVVPSNNPEAVLYLAIDNPKHTAMLSSYTTTPIARRILLDIIEALDIKKQDSQIEKEKEWSDKTIYEVPNVVGMTKKEAKKALENFTVEYAGTGDKVVSQSPEAGTRVEEKTVVRLLLK